MLLPLLLTMTKSDLPLPTPRQLEWQDMETNAFVHFGPNTFTDVEWGGGKEGPNLFNPTDLDCDQWVAAFKSAGFKGVIVTAKHHDGFCLWPSKLSTHTVAQSQWMGGKGDVLLALSTACRKGGLKFGFYLSPWDRNHPAYGTDAYNQVFAGMLKEVLTHYGPIFEVWFDGANGEGPNGKKQVYDWPLFYSTVRKYQPQAVMFSDGGPDVRWVGNEEGHAPETCWATIPSNRYVAGTPYSAELGPGSEFGDLWVPAECDVSIRPGWFYHASEDSKVKSGEALLDLYEQSVGRNSLLLLNVPPDRRGHLADPDADALKAFGDLRKHVYGKNLLTGATFSSADGPLGKDWKLAGASPQISASLPRTVAFDRVLLGEDIRQGQRIRFFVVEAKVGNAWQQLARGTTVGHLRIVPVPRTTAQEVRVRITDAKADPIIARFGLYLR